MQGDSQLFGSSQAIRGAQADVGEWVITKPRRGAETPGPLLIVSAALRRRDSAHISFGVSGLRSLRSGWQSARNKPSPTSRTERCTGRHEAQEPIAAQVFESVDVCQWLSRFSRFPGPPSPTTRAPALGATAGQVDLLRCPRSQGSQEWTGGGGLVEESVSRRV
ncbi:unnamed protein product [Arctogadus glacialis]